jgi:hypothetical protein
MVLVKGVTAAELTTCGETPILRGSLTDWVARESVLKKASHPVSVKSHCRSKSRTYLGPAWAKTEGHSAMQPVVYCLIGL